MYTQRWRGNNYNTTTTATVIVNKGNNENENSLGLKKCTTLTWEAINIFSVLLPLLFLLSCLFCLIFFKYILFHHLKCFDSDEQQCHILSTLHLFKLTFSMRFTKSNFLS